MGPLSELRTCLIDLCRPKHSTLDLVVGTMSGELLSIATGEPSHHLNTWSSELRGRRNGFVHGGYQGCLWRKVD